MTGLDTISEVSPCMREAEATKRRSKRESSPDFQTIGYIIHKFVHYLFSDQATDEYLEQNSVLSATVGTRSSQSSRQNI